MTGRATSNRVPRVYFTGIVSINHQGQATVVPAGWYEKIYPYKKAVAK